MTYPTTKSKRFLNSTNQHYDLNKDRYKEKYENKKELLKARNSYYYYHKKDDMETFRTKYPDRYELLVNDGYFKL